MQNKCADTCTYFLILTNEFIFQKVTNKAGSADDSAGEDDVDIKNEIDMVEVILAKSKSHVRMYQIQRNWRIKFISIVCLYITYHLPSLFPRKWLTIEMGKKLCLPKF